MKQSDSIFENGVTRREVLVGAGMAALAMSSVANAAQQGHKHDHETHKVQQPELLGDVNACIDMGQRCIAHCLVMFQEGDTSVADCASKVHEMNAICGGFSYLLTANSNHSKAMAELCRTVCTECAEECRKHDEHHECRACAEACERTVVSLDNYLG